MFSDLGSNFWIGVTDQAEEGVWRSSVTGALLDFTDFGFGQPSNTFGVEHCVVVRGVLWDWNDENCIRENYFICEL